MREIKVRIWLPGIKKMTYPHTIEELMNWGTKEWTNGTAEFLQFTGLKDKNGKEIYEGDVVKVNKLSFPSSGPLPENLIVKYFGGMFQLFRGNESLMGLHLLYIEDGEVIGNIYENPELLVVMDS